MLGDGGCIERAQIKRNFAIFIGGGKDCITGNFWNAFKHFNDEKNRKGK